MPNDSKRALEIYLGDASRILIPEQIFSQLGKFLRDGQKKLKQWSWKFPDWDGRDKEETESTPRKVKT